MTKLETASSELAIIEERKAKVLESLSAIELLILNVKKPLAKEMEALEQKAKELDNIQADELKRYKSLIAEKLWDLIEEHLTTNVLSLQDKRITLFHEVCNDSSCLRFLYYHGYQEIYVEFAGKTIFKALEHQEDSYLYLTLPAESDRIAELLNLLNLD